MRQVNFVVIFVICLALVLFAIENTAPATIHIVRGVDIDAPLCIELMISLGVGAVLAWVFSVWVQVQGYFNINPQVQQREMRIQQLEEDVERYRVELEDLQPMLPGTAKVTETEEAAA
ncbi:lipopolysaccharide assembly protein LapA domain-containing protein [Leptothoe spongobia]|uniref:LapA family protein n=1 Tax=Leptothoe spongobia TAU-MAC 1115 TaxID=1967444 RepID=A0A947DIY5_9CYAN|nr:LapA family protein [Leptothoe spongobia]MBT9316851.1 LapA family protein [Leptothoe spongobia TAU-MAC 1115]